MVKKGALMMVCLLAAVSWAQQPKADNNTAATPPATQSGKSMADMPGMDKESSSHVMHSMEGRHMDMGPHMKMTALREPQPDDAQRAARVAESARNVAEKYRDYKTALADGFKIFLPNIPQKMYHFTNYSYGFQAIFHFDPDQPTSLLYEKHGGGYKLIGVMYTAAKNASENELNERVPLSVAQWHAHVNLCLPPPDRRNEILGAHPQFGLRGSITTKAACDAAGGNFRPQVFGWMVHVYPFEKTPEDVWSVGRQMHGHMD
jgi:hypothetical protein